MNELKYYVLKIKAKVGSILLGKEQKEIISEGFRKVGMQIGQNVNICTNIKTSEPFLISIDDNTTVSFDAKIITHDAAMTKVSKGEFTDIFGAVRIGKNCFIGAGSIILCGVEICDNVVVAAGSIVTHSIQEESIIVAGNPAKKIGTWDAYYNKYRENAYNLKKEGRSNVYRELANNHSRTIRKN